ncbi:hypothetical protein I540_4118 [Mycobacteroides abscessus subsp. bolletii 1513]|uniref:Uncharacterized protein n=1 Tax=Mycobacteroides abscessus subsp. bolletii 1513 TaxID=1299321 RepID=X8DGJ3_9MYCO|nr:hypothetical protein I540_4118 [Mycobacteroides abscessus subsp. bolletii 1513]
MSGDENVLKVDLAALGKLGPHLRMLAGQLTEGTAASVAAPAGADPGWRRCTECPRPSRT